MRILKHQTEQELSFDTLYERCCMERQFSAFHILSSLFYAIPRRQHRIRERGRQTRNPSVRKSKRASAGGEGDGGTGEKLKFDKFLSTTGQQQEQQPAGENRMLK